MNRKGDTSPSNMSETLLAIIFIVIGFFILLGPGTWNRIKATETSKEGLFVIDKQRDLLYLFLEPQKDGTLADLFIRGEYDDLRLNAAGEFLRNRLEEKNSELSGENIKPWVTMKISGKRVLYEDTPNAVTGKIEGADKIFPLTMYIPSLDGGIISIETRVAHISEYVPENKNKVSP